MKVAIKETPPDSVDDVAIHVVWKQLSQNHQQALSQFWIAQRAIADPAEARRRTADAVCLGLDKNGEIAGVSTVYTQIFPVDHQQYYFLRTFIRPDARKDGLAKRLLKFTIKALSDDVFSQQDQLQNRPKGVVIVTENPKLKRRGVMRYFKEHGFHLLGVTPEQRQVWRLTFNS